MTKEKWKQMTEEEHEMYWERHYALWRAVLLPPAILIGSYIGIKLSEML